MQRAVRVLVTLAMSAWIVSTVDWSEVPGLVQRADPVFLLLSFIAEATLLTLSAWRWRSLHAAVGGRIGLSPAVRLYAVGVFFSQLLPTTVGGDVARVYGMAKTTGDPKALAAASVFFDRLIGFGTFMVAALVTLPLLFQRIEVAGVAWLVGGAAAGFGLVVGMIVADWPHVPESWLGTEIGRRLDRVRRAVARFRAHPSAVGKAIGISVLFFGMALVNLWVTARAFGVSLPLADTLVAPPLLTLAGLVPAIGGVGVVEGTYVGFFQAIGQMAGAGLAVALLMRLKVILIGLVGIWLMPGWRSLRESALADSEGRPDPPAIPRPGSPALAIARPSSAEVFEG